MTINYAEKTLENMNQAHWYNQWTLKKFENYLRGDILEVGFGIGNFTKFLTKYRKIWAIDIEKEYIRGTKKLIGKKAKIGFGDIEKGKYFFGSKKFDCIVCLNVLEHIKDDGSAIKNLVKLLKEGGLLILLVPAHSFLYTRIDEFIGHFRRYERENLLKKLSKEALKIIFTRRINFVGAIGWFIAGKIFGMEYVGESNIKLFNFFSPVILSFENILEPPIGTSLIIIAKKANLRV